MLIGFFVLWLSMLRFSLPRRRTSLCTGRMLAVRCKLTLVLVTIGALNRAGTRCSRYKLARLLAAQPVFGRRGQSDLRAPTHVYPGRPGLTSRFPDIIVPRRKFARVTTRIAAAVTRANIDSPALCSPAASFRGPLALRMLAPGPGLHSVVWCRDGSDFRVFSSSALRGSKRGKPSSFLNNLRSDDGNPPLT